MKDGCGNGYGNDVRAGRKVFKLEGPTVASEGVAKQPLLKLVAKKLHNVMEKCVLEKILRK